MTKLVLIFIFAAITSSSAGSVFIGKEEASQYLRKKRANSYFEELWEGNAERECIEETCSYEEVREVFEDDQQAITYWRQLVAQCHTDLYSCNDEGTYECQSLYNKHVCLCKSGYVGRRCESEIQVDTNHVCKNYVNLCKNGGTCVDDEEDSYYCLCPPGWRGTQCSLDIDECEDYPCINGNCINTIGAFTCSCDVGFLGILCEIEDGAER